MQQKNGHIAENPNVQEEEVDRIYYKGIESDISNPGALVLGQQNKKPRRNNEDIGYESSWDSVLHLSACPLDVGNVPKGWAYAESSSYPSEERGSLSEVEPRAYYFIIPIAFVSVCLIFGAMHVVINPIYIQKQVLPWVHDHHKCTQ